MNSLGRQSLDESLKYPIALSGEEVATLFDGTETFSAVLLRGDGQPAAATLAASWKDGTVGTSAPVVDLVVSAAAIADLTPGIYYVRVLIDPGTRDIAATPPGTTLELVAGAGDATALATYCDLDDVRRVCPWIDRVVQTETSVRSNLEEQRHAARAWLDEVILAHAPVYRYGSGPSFGGLPTWLGTSRRWLRDHLDADALLVTPQIRRVQALYAAAEALASSEVKEQRAQAAGYFARATAEMPAEVELDTDGDGEPDLTIDLSVIRSVRG